MRRSSDIVAQFRKVVADTPQSGLEVLGLVLVVVTAKDVEVLSGEIDDLLAPNHIVGPLLPTRNDLRIGSDGSQPAAVDVDNLGVFVRREAVIHGLVIDLEVPDAVGFGVPVRGA